MKRTMTASAAFVLLVAGVLLAQSNIDNTVPNKHAWGENVGWTNWFDANVGLDGVNVGAFVMAGNIWGENIGWINVGDGTPASPPYYANVNGTDFGVNIDGDGDLHGYGWGENVGWINFDGGAMASPPQPARIECGNVSGGIRARLAGYAWGENIGWINLDDLNATKFVSLDLASTPLNCDVNDDGFRNGLDVQPFVTIMLSGGASWQQICAGDVETIPDVSIDIDDVTPFVNCLLTGP